jgi:cyclopropane-fatty-acyl-phospholipid synthase
MIEKQILHAVFSRLRRGAVKVTYWDGSTITYGNETPWAHVTFKSRAAARSVLKNLTLGFGEAYMDGTIEVNGPFDQLARLVAENQSAFDGLMLSSKIKLPTRNKRGDQSGNIQHHYDLGNDFYKLWLDESMTYSCAYFKTPKDTLEQAQSQKVDHLLKKLQLKKGQRVLDIGSGWGTLLIRAAKQYGIKGLGITLSKEQHAHSQAEAKRLGLDKQIQFELINYQDLAEREPAASFDRIISVGMYEHVGKNNQKLYFDAVEKLLKQDGLSVLHTISNQSGDGFDPWIDKYIFPGGHIPSIQSIVEELPRHQFDMIDYENLRIHYALTLEEWWRRFEKNKAKVIKMYDERFYRMWRMYLASCAANFRWSDLELSQVVFVKNNNNELPLTREHIYK